MRAAGRRGRTRTTRWGGGDGGERRMGPVFHVRWVREYDSEDGNERDGRAGIFDDDQSGDERGTDELRPCGTGRDGRGESAVRRSERTIHLRSCGKAGA